MKITIIAALFPPYRRGGAEVVVETVARELAKEHDVSVLTVKPFASLRSLVVSPDTESVVPGIRVMRFFPLNLFSFVHIHRHGVFSRLIWHAFDMFNLHSFFAVRGFLKREQPDIILTHNLKGIGYTVPAAVRSFRKTTIGKHVEWAHTVHDLGPLYPRGVLQYGQEQSFGNVSLPVRIYGAINRWLFGSPPLVVSRAHFFLGYFAARGWFSHSRIARLTHDASARAETVAAAPSALWKFLFVGQLEHYKGVHVLLDAWRRARSSGLTGELHIVGQGSLVAEVERLARLDTSIIYHGQSLTNQHLLAELMPQMHVALVPTLVYENTPLVLIEAYAAGLPVVASSLGGVREALRDGESGYLVEPANPQALADAIMLITRSEWQPMHLAARARWQEYDARDFARELFALLFHSQTTENQL